MSPTVRTGVLIGVLCTVWMFVMGFTGWYRHPTLNFLFLLVILVEVVLLLQGLKQTAPGNTYGQQVVTGVAMSAIAAVVIFCGSMIFTTVAFPDYFREVEEAGRQAMQARGMTPDAIDAAIAAQRPMQTPVINAATGAVATVITGLLASVLIAMRHRRRPAATPATSA